MATKAEKLEFYKKKLQERGYEDVDEDLLEKIVDLLGPSIFRDDAELVACSDEGELERIVDSFLVGKLHLEDEPVGELLATVKDVCEELSEYRKKYRAPFYYILVKKLGVEQRVFDLE